MWVCLPNERRAHMPQQKLRVCEQHDYSARFRKVAGDKCRYCHLETDHLCTLYDDRCFPESRHPRNRFYTTCEPQWLLVSAFDVYAGNGCCVDLCANTRPLDYRRRDRGYLRTDSRVTITRDHSKSGHSHSAGNPCSLNELPATLHKPDESCNRSRN